MIILTFLEQTFCPINQATLNTVLGEERFQHLEEAVIPQTPSSLNPIAITKKFVGRSEYRWRVVDVLITTGQSSSVQVEILLTALPQLLKNEYLSNILKIGNKQAQSTLHRFAIVEVDYGHPQDVIKLSGALGSNKRYVDTVQRGSMPKRRLGIVNKVVVKNKLEVVQIIPISSKPPVGDDKSMIEVTSSLQNFVNYNKSSWAVCGMMESVAPSRIIAPLIRWKDKFQNRDSGFKHSILAADRPALEEALLYGVACETRVANTQELLQLRPDLEKLTNENNRLQSEVEHLKSHLVNLAVYKEMAIDLAKGLGRKFEELESDYAEVYKNN